MKHIPFQKWLVQRRKTLNYSQLDLSRASGVSPSTISKLEIGIHQPSAGNLRKLAPALQVTREQIQDAAEGRRVEEVKSLATMAIPADVAARLEAMRVRMSIPADELLRIACDVLERVYRR